MASYGEYAVATRCDVVLPIAMSSPPHISGRLVAASSYVTSQAAGDSKHALPLELILSAGLQCLPAAPGSSAAARQGLTA